MCATRKFWRVLCFAFFFWLVTQRHGFESQQARSVALLVSPPIKHSRTCNLGAKFEKFPMQSPFPSVLELLCITSPFFWERLALHTFWAKAPCLRLKMLHAPKPKKLLRGAWVFHASGKTHRETCVKSKLAKP